MRVENIMQSPVVVTQKDKSIAHVRGFIDRKGVNSLPVLKLNGEIAGIITANDIAKVHDDSLKVEDVMTTRVNVAMKESTVSDVAKMMIKNNCHHIVIMEEGQVIGMVSSLDIVRVMAEM